MGFTIYANNGSRDFDGGMDGFMNLRTNIALAFDKEFGEHYSTLRSCFRGDDYKVFTAKTNKILSHDRFKQEDGDIVDFYLLVIVVVKYRTRLARKYMTLSKT